MLHDHPSSRRILRSHFCSVHALSPPVDRFGHPVLKGPPGPPPEICQAERIPVDLEDLVLSVGPKAVLDQAVSPGLLRNNVEYLFQSHSGAATDIDGTGELASD